MTRKLKHNEAYLLDFIRQERATKVGKNVKRSANLMEESKHAVARSTKLLREMKERRSARGKKG